MRIFGSTSRSSPYRNRARSLPPKTPMQLQCSEYHGFSSPMRKFGYSLTDSIPLAVCLVQGGGFVGLVVYLIVTKKYREIVISRETVLWFGASGLLNALAVSFNMTALEMGDVVVVSPLISTTPLFTVLFSIIFLRSFERVTGKIVMGAAAICLGGIVLTAF